MMRNSDQDILEIIKRYLNPKIGYVFIFLIISQYIVFPVISKNLALHFGKSVDYSYFYIMSSYTLITLGLIILRSNNKSMLSDHISLWLIVFSCFVRPGSQGGHELLYTLYLSFLGLLLSIYIITNRKGIAVPSGHTVIVGFLWSVATVVIIAFAQKWLAWNPITDLPRNLIYGTLNNFFYQLSSVTVIEEVCFRGLLVGFMIMSGYKEDLALFIQAILFWGAHYMYITTVPLTFFVSLPLLTISTTLIMKKYKMIFLPIMVHTLVNVFAYSLTYALQKYFL